MNKDIVDILITAAKDDDLYSIPFEQLTPIICETAFDIYYKVFKYIPNDIKHMICV